MARSYFRPHPILARWGTRKALVHGEEATGCPSLGSGAGPRGDTEAGVRSLAGGGSDGPFRTLTDGEEQGARPLKPSAPLADRPAGNLEQTLFAFQISHPAQGHGPGATRCPGSERHFQCHEADGHSRVTGQRRPCDGAPTSPAGRLHTSGANE